jgi:hypothetical protein
VEPIASTGAGAVFRPASGAGSEVLALLREGRLLRAEVLPPGPGGTVLLAIGRHVIPAETDVRLDPGARFLVLVEHAGEGVVLRVLVPEGNEAALLRALRGVVGEEPRLGEALGELGRALREAGESELAPELRSLAQGLAAQLGRPAGSADALRARLLALGLGHEAALAALLGARSARPALAELRGDLKALLLRARGAAGNAGSERGGPGAAVARALASLEGEQLLNLARERSGEPLLFSFPFPDGDRWVTARLAVPARHRDGEGRAGEEAPFRVVLGLELSSLGALRADLTLTPSLLSVRLLVTRAEVALRIEAERSGLRTRMGDGRRAVELQVRIGTAAEAEEGLLPLDTRYLREHNLMDVVA